MTHQQIAMRRAAWILLATGALFALSAIPALHSIVWIFLQAAYWPLQTVPAELATPVPLLVAISGGLTAGLGGMLLGLGKFVAPIAPDAAAKVAQMAAWSWFCIDSAGSLLAGAPMNVVLNVGFLVLMLASSRPRTEESATAT